MAICLFERPGDEAGVQVSITGRLSFILGFLQKSGCVYMRFKVCKENQMINTRSNILTEIACANEIDQILNTDDHLHSMAELKKENREEGSICNGNHGSLKGAGSCGLVHLQIIGSLFSLV